MMYVRECFAYVLLLEFYSIVIFKLCDFSLVDS